MKLVQFVVIKNAKVEKMAYSRKFVSERRAAEFKRIIPAIVRGRRGWQQPPAKHAEGGRSHLQSTQRSAEKLCELCKCFSISLQTLKYSHSLRLCVQ